MTEDLKRLVNAVEGQGPSAEFVARGRALIVAETERSRAGVGDHAAVRTIDVVPDPIIGAVDEPDADVALVVELEALQRDNELTERRTRTQRRTQLLAVAAAVAVVFIGIWALTSGDSDEPEEVDTVDTPTTTTIEAPDLDTDGELGAPLTAGNTFFDAGTFRIDTLGTAITITVEETRGMLLNESDIVLITDLTSANVDDRTITFRRTSLLPDPTAPTADFDHSTGWLATDLVGWLELLPGDIAASAPTSTTFGGLDASYVELEFPCKGVDCAASVPTQTPEMTMFTPGSRYRLWVVDQSQEDPIVVIVAIDDEDETPWFDEAEGIIATVEFGSIEPNPVRRVPPGSLELDVFDGISLELPEEAVIVEPFDGFTRIFPAGIAEGREQLPGLGWGGDVEFLTRPLDTEGVEVTTTERMVELLEDEAAEMSELATVDVGGYEAQRFDVDSGGNPNVVLSARTADLARSEFGWESPRVGRLWVIEHPERGLLLVSAESWAGDDDFEPLRDWTDALLRSLEFREP